MKVWGRVTTVRGILEKWFLEKKFLRGNGFFEEFFEEFLEEFLWTFLIILRLFLSCWCFFLTNSMLWRIILSLYFFKLYVFKKYLSIKYLNLVVFWKTSTDLFLYKLLFYLAEWLIGNTYLIISPLHIKKCYFAILVSFYWFYT